MQEQIVKSHKDLIVWQKSMDLVTLVYKITEDFPAKEIYCLTSQIRRAAISIPSNIAEGRRRGSKKDYTQFLRIAFGSGAELETQLEIALRLRYTNKVCYQEFYSLHSEVMKMLSAMISGLQATS